MIARIFAWLAEREVGGRSLSRTAACALCALGFTPVLAGCGLGATRLQVTAQKAAYPISLTSVLPDAQGRLLSKPDDLEEMTLFELEQTRTTLVYGTSGGDLDISDEVNRQVRESEGEGIVDLNFSARPCVHNALPFLSFLPFWPSCMIATVRGEIVRRKKGVPR